MPSDTPESVSRSERLSGRDSRLPSSSRLTIADTDGEEGLTYTWTPAEVEERAASYRAQALIYAWAAQCTTGMPVREVVLLFARTGVEHATRVDASFLAEAEALLSRPGLAP